MTIMLKEFIKGCAICQQMKPNTHPTASPLMPIQSITHCPFQQITMDFIMDLPKSNGFDSIFVVVDQRLSKGVILSPCNKTITAIETAELYIREVFKRYGLPDIMISDCGLQFAAKVFQEIMKVLQVKHKMSTTYHLQTDGQTERLNQELEVYLQIFCANLLNSWNAMLPIAEFTHNSCMHEELKQSPFHLIYGTEPIALPKVIHRMNAPTAEGRIIALKIAREEALAAHDLAHQKMTQRTMHYSKPFKLGQKVWLESKNLRIPYPSRKLAPKREGPFLIKQVIGPVTYHLTLPKQWKIHNIFHACLLTPYNENDIHGPNETRLPPDLINGFKEYEVELIRAHKGNGTRRRYLIKWRNYNSSNNTWQPEDNLNNTEQILKKYKRTHC